MARRDLESPCHFFVMPLLARTVIDASVNLVIGHCPHVLRGTAHFFLQKPGVRIG